MKTYRDILTEGKLKFQSKDHEKNFKIIYDAKKKAVKADGEISEPMMVAVKGRGIKFPGFQTMYVDRNGKKIYKMWAIDERGYDIFIK